MAVFILRPIMPLLAATMIHLWEGGQEEHPTPNPLLHQLKCPLMKFSTNIPLISGRLLTILPNFLMTTHVLLLVGRFIGRSVSYNLAFLLINIHDLRLPEDTCCKFLC